MDESVPVPVPPAEPWAQLPGEPDEAYARFLLYRNIGPGRSQQAAYDTYLLTFRNAGPPPAGKSAKKPQVPGHWNDDSAKYRWVDRATAWDIHQLQHQGPELARLWAGILIAAARKCAEKLAHPNCRPKDFMQALAVVDKLAPFLSPDAVKSLQPPAADPRARPKPDRKSVK